MDRERVKKAGQSVHPLAESGILFRGEVDEQMKYEIETVQNGFIFRDCDENCTNVFKEKDELILAFLDKFGCEADSSYNGNDSTTTIVYRERF